MRWGRGWGCPGSWADGEFHTGRDWPPSERGPAPGSHGATPRSDPRPARGRSRGCVSGAGGVPRELFRTQGRPGPEVTDGPAGFRAPPAGPAQLTRQRRRRGLRAGRVVGAGWGASPAGRSPVPAAPPGPAGAGGASASAAAAAAAAGATGAARGLRGEEQWVPPPGPAPCPPRPARAPTLPPSGLGSGARGLRSPGLGIFQAAEVQLTELGAPPRPAPQGPSARPRPPWEGTWPGEDSSSTRGLGTGREGAKLEWILRGGALRCLKRDSGS